MQLELHWAKDGNENMKPFFAFIHWVLNQWNPEALDAFHFSS